MHKIIEIENGVTRHPNHRMVNPIDFTMCDGEQIAVVGANGAGKTMFVETITGKWPLLYANKVKYDFSPSASPLISDNLKYIAFRDAYGDADVNYYYQQRWNSQDLEDVPLVRDRLPEATDLEFKKEIFNLFQMDEMLDKPIVLLSSGELRKFQLTKMLLNHPRVLIMDNPFIGLDAPTRNQLKELINKLIHHSNLQVILVLSKTDDIPLFITHVVSIHDRFMEEKMPVDEYLKQRRLIPAHVLSKKKIQMILDLPYAANLYHTEHIVDLNKVSIRYGERTILKELNWTVKCGEKWALRGENGSGKSTLLSLVCADNPQSYACDITLFDRKRGTGESIWEIKKHIGYVSPEMYRAYLKSLPTVDIVASGLHDSVGLYKKTLPEEKAICEWWMDIFGIGDLADRNYLDLSSGEQRLALLARAFVKDPELLILDEPLHGLDLVNCRLVKDIIEAFCRRKDKSMIMVTHYDEELPSCIDHTIFLKKNV
ncbi:ATP-binding cassette domain-containing protein [Phocaeicola oris]|uniref:ATP-binding cassette domain-containing protein n=1 Tax=Phocaeicola oris TaxID=2896850 RepID=UPI00234F7DA0|nr:ATP-binding cassette domain-containing protein [Phocaeicola oris]MCE2617353.1 ATP-binding cassette domain-containing protein [Phocaeicola oris]